MPPELLAADSWLVVDGRARALDRHRTRFLAACAEATGPAPGEVETFWESTIAGLPRAGAWWPRVELTAAGELRTLLRPAPPRAEPDLILAVARDPRTEPRRKGPDLDRLAVLRAAHPRAGELVLVGDDGHAREGTTASLLWWEGETLCHPDPGLPVLTGVTASLLVEAAAAQGVHISASRTTATGLAGRDVWMVNAVRGVRPVTGWADGSAAAPDLARAERWQRWLDDQRRPVAASE